MGYDFSIAPLLPKYPKPLHVLRHDGLGAAAPWIAGEKRKSISSQLQGLLSHGLIALGR